MDTRKLYADLKNLGTVQNAEDFGNLFSYKPSTIRSKWAKGTTPDLAAWVRLWFAMNAISEDTEEAIKTVFNEDRIAYIEGLKELRKLQTRVWQHVVELAT